MWSRVAVLFVLTCAAAQSGPPVRESSAAQQAPRRYVYREIEGQTLNAYVFTPLNQDTARPTSAVILVHGGAWVVGSAEWTFDAARHFADLGMVAVAIDYRLSGGKITPIEAEDDTRAAFRWVRQRASEFHLDPRRVAGYGVSAGGQLVAVAAMLDSPDDRVAGVRSRPDLLLLWSPAVDAPTDRLQGRASASDYSPIALAGSSTPPTYIVNGDKDTVTPLARAELFRERVVRAGGTCELHVYQGVGHLLTRNLSNQLSDFDPDPRFRADAIARMERFLRAQGYLAAN